MRSMGVVARICVLAAFIGCGGGSQRHGRPAADGGADSGADAAATADAGNDAAAVEAGADAAAAVDAASDPDAAADAGSDRDAAVDAGNDAAAVDAGNDAAADPRCDDGVRNGDESDLDCGGSCARCSTGDACATPDDCETGICAAGSCSSTFVLRGRVFDTLGAAVQGAEVHVASGESAVSDANGAFEFTVAAGNDIVFVSADGYAPTAGAIRGVVGELTVHAIVSAVGATATFSSGDPIFFQRSDGLRVEAPSGVFVGEDGQAVSGAVTLQLTPIDPNDPLAMRSAPLTFLADDGAGRRAPIAPAALMDITALAGSQRLDVAPGSALLVDIPVLGENPTLDAEVWSFDEAAGLWKREGDAVRTVDDLGQPVYRTEITHLSWWSWVYTDGSDSFGLYRWECVDVTVTRNKIPLPGALVHFSPAFYSEWTYGNGKVGGAYLYRTGPIVVHAHTADNAYTSAEVTLPPNTGAACRKPITLDITVPGAPSCPSDSQWCAASGACKNTSSDRANCGSCSNVCATGMICRAGACACDAGKTSCNGTCVDLKADRQNCGACGSTCLDWQECTAGACVAKPCPSGLTRCGAACVDVDADNDAHCGACNQSCPGDDYCRAGECIIVPFCGDAQLESGEWTEVCDDGTNDGSYGSCTPDCLAFGPRCGDAILQASDGEICENGSGTPCPASCDDGEVCTADALLGSATTCDAECSNTPIVAPAAGDACCPPGANANTDADCPPVCGNDIVEPGEICDDGTNDGGYGGCMPDCDAYAPFCGDGVIQAAFLETCDPLSATPCPANCDDAEACTADVQLGAPETCTIACMHTPITAFEDGDACCPAGADALTDGDCPPVCGNGVVEEPEVCDDTLNDGAYDGCASGCLSFGPYCGDGIRNGTELCDGDCLVNCLQIDPCTEVSLLGSAETCDLRCEGRPITAPKHDDLCCPTGANAANDNDCDPECANSVVEPGEACDDGDEVDGDGCSADCASDESCGNRIVDTAAGEVCDDGNTTSGDGCAADCKSGEVCGNGIVDASRGEVCDDGDTTGGDGCSANCKSDETCGNNIVDALAGEVCDDGNSTSEDGCNVTCTARWEVISPTAGPSSTCSVRADGKAYCGGYPCTNLGVTGSSNEYAITPRVVLGGRTDWASIASGAAALASYYGRGHRCALTVGGLLFCWGENGSGQIGNGTSGGELTTPVQIGTATWRSVAGGANFTIAIKSDGTLCQWGINRGATGGGQTTPNCDWGTSLGTPNDGWSVAEGWGHSHCLRRMDGAVYCSLNATLPYSPKRVGTDFDWLDTGAGRNHICGIRGSGTSGTLWCWGYNENGELGFAGPSTGNGVTDGTDLTAAPTQVGSDDGWREVASGDKFSCAVKSEGSLWCWGSNVNGELGVGDRVRRTEPTRVGTELDWTTVTCGPSHACAVKWDGRLYCWGRNSDGQLGQSPSAFPSSTLPVAIP